LATDLRGSAARSRPAAVRRFLDSESRLRPHDQIIAVNYEFKDTSNRAGRMRFRELLPGENRKENEGYSKIASGRNYLATDLSQSVWIPPGHSIRFVANRDHLQINFAINVYYKYAWENNDGDTDHRVFFYASDLPTD
jgi:hypothetical protein